MSSSLSQTISRNDGIKIAGNSFEEEEEEEEAIVISEAVAPIAQVTQISREIRRRRVRSLLHSLIEFSSNVFVQNKLDGGGGGGD